MKNNSFIKMWGLCHSRNLRFIKIQEASGLSSSLEIKAGLNKFPIFGATLFKMYKKNEIINKCLLAGD